ncbi:uncharacterized protein LOC113495128 [Trichoplusia ni]|uniref:Uncharacterized protein LOC113495128 n=1 Tax=Trichoplusia ni TaxID=7111 RepID=A0A7E5VMM0_TRINI|nr:uncharacterized protein LOC113495128 [Trichoplusia ni]
MDVMDEDSLCRICVTSFTEEDITTAKSLLFDSVPTTKRKIQRKRDGKAKRDIDDIICLLKETDPELIPIFVARDLQILPPVLFDHLDCTRLLKELQLMKREITDLKESKEQYVTTQQLESVKNDIKHLKSSDKDIPQTKTKCGGCMLLNEFEDSDSFNTIISAPTSPLLHSSRVVGRLDKNVEGRSMSIGNNGGVPVINSATSDEKAMTHRSGNVSALSAEALATDCVTAVGHTAVLDGEHVGKQPTFANVVRSEKNVVSQDNDGWTLVQRKFRNQRFAGKKGSAVIKPEEKFKAAEIMLPLYISNVSKGLSVDDIVSYIRGKSRLLVKVEKLTMKIDKEYDSYKIFIPKHKEDIFMRDDFWPDGISYRRFINFRNNFGDKAETRKLNTIIR